jgi:hypothetical protein
VSRIPSYRGASLDLSGPIGQRAEAGRVAGALYSAKTPQEAQALLGGAYHAADTSALAFNQALFNTTQQGYRDLLADQTTAQQAVAGGYGELADRVRQRNEAIGAGYGQLQGDVLGDIAGLGASRARDIGDAYERSLAANQQRLISSGLGNSTVLGSIDRGLTTDRERALNENAERVSGLRADYRSRLGQAGLNFRERGLGMEAGLGQAGLAFDERAAANNAGLVQNQLGWMNTIQAPYPDAGMYAALAQQYGAAGQGMADRNLLMQLAGQDRAFAQQQAGQAGRGADVEAPAFGGGYARGAGGLAPPQGATLGGTVLSGAGGYFGQPGVGMGAFTGGQTAGAVYADPLAGVGGYARGYAGDVPAGEAKGGGLDAYGALAGGTVFGPALSGVKPGADDAGAYRGDGGYASADYSGYLGGMFGY